MAYQTAYLKTFFPNQYMAAFLTFESAANKVSEWIPYLEDCRRTRFVEPSTGKVIKTGVEVRPPDVNLSDADFTVVYGPDEPRTAGAGHVRFGLGAIKGAGEKAIEATIAERSGAAKKSPDEQGTACPTGTRVPFTSMFDFCERVLARGNGILNKATIEALVRCGAFDSIHGRNNRAAMVATIEQAVSAGQKAAADKASGQGALFGFGGGFDEPKSKSRDAGAGSGAGGSGTPLAKAAPWTEAESLANEKEVLGFYISSHPLDTWKSWYSVFATANTATAKDMPQDTRVILPGLVQSLRQLVVKTGRSAGQKMAIVTFEDTFGAVEAVVFTDAFAKYAHLLDPNSAGVVFLLGRLDRSRGDAQVIVERVVPIDGVPVLPGRLQLILDDNRLNGSGTSALKAVAEIVKPKSNAGPAGFPLELVVLSGQTAATLQADPRMRVGLDPVMVREVEDQIGPGTVRVVNGVTAEAEKGNARPWEGKRWGAEVGG